MGIAISYRGRLKSVDLIESFCEELIKIAELMGWDYNVLDEDFSKPTDARIDATENRCEIVGHLAIKGINLNIHEKCSSLSFFFDSDGILRDLLQMVEPRVVEGDGLPYTFLKTQSAPLEVHMTVVKLLRFLGSKYFETFEVSDEGQYWETGDAALLKEKMDFLAGKMDIVAHALENSHLKSEPGDTTLDTIAKVDKILRELAES